MWLPITLLPSQGVTWNPIDERLARAMLTAGTTIVSLDLTFGAAGLVQSVFTPARMRDVNGRAIPMPGQGRFAR